MQHVITCIVQNRSGVLAHIANMFASRGFNIDSLVVGTTQDVKISRMTIVVRGDDMIIDQVRKQLGKIIDVIKVVDFTDVDYVERDLLLVKVNAPPSKRSEISHLVDIFRGRVLDVSPREMIVEMVGSEEKIESFLDLIRSHGIKEVSRTGRIAMARGPKMAGENRRERWEEAKKEMAM
jgi:acetolactate synthase-1/3 small subunit